MKNQGLFGFLLFLLFFVNIPCQTQAPASGPWTYWWWMGSAVNPQNIDLQLEKFRASGIQGVHIIPIYGVKGYEEQELPFLSEEWMKMVQHTIDKAASIGMGVDITLGTGWPYGGQGVERKYAASFLLHKTFNLGNTNTFHFSIDSIKKRNNIVSLLSVVAISEKGHRIDLGGGFLKDTLLTNLPQASWILSCYAIANTNQHVKRAAPGGEGLVIDYFNHEAVNRYLHLFDSIFHHTALPITLRAVYHDSYEVFKANFSTRFVTTFESRYQYTFLELLSLLEDEDTLFRKHLIHDMREHLSYLLYEEFAKQWTDWAGKHQFLTRYQAHGSPGNLLDLYALASIPETESFGCSVFSIPGLECDKDYEENRYGRPSPLMMKFASSPAHLLGKPLVSSETGTWLANHFKVCLSSVKPQVDELFISGINHIFYHGITYSPVEEKYPGWLFYASTNFGPMSHFWDEMPLLNSYISSCQEALRQSTPDNDILLYFPADDIWTKTSGDMLLMFDVHQYSEWFGSSSFGETASLLWENGYAFDYLSDRQCMQLRVNDKGKVFASQSSSYSLIIIPPIDYIPAATLIKLDSLAKKGVPIVFMKQFPAFYPGYHDNISRNSGTSELAEGFYHSENVIITSSLLESLEEKGMRRESMKLRGLDFIRKKNGQQTLYFITNLGNRFYADSIQPEAKGKYAVITDISGKRSGYIERDNKLYLQLPPGKSCLLTLSDEKPLTVAWDYFHPMDTLIIGESWEVSFQSRFTEDYIRSFTRDTLSSWTSWGNDSLEYFCGKGIYKTTFELPSKALRDKKYRLYFEKIDESAEIILNGETAGTIWAYPLFTDLPATLLKEHNTLEIRVQNCSANLIRKIDRERPEWKKFKDINLVDIRYQPFDAGNWETEPSGLSGKVYFVVGR